MEQLRAHGYKMTTPRRAVLIELLTAGRDHMSAEQIAAAVRERHPDVDVSTVYRTLSVLEKIGAVQHAHLGHGPAVYHLGETHHHLICEECGAITDVPIAVMDDLAARLRRDYGFELHPDHFVGMGRCAAHRTLG